MLIRTDLPPTAEMVSSGGIAGASTVPRRPAGIRPVICSAAGAGHPQRWGRQHRGLPAPPMHNRAS